MKEQSLSLKEKEAIREIARNELIVFNGFVNPHYQASWLHREIARQLERIDYGEIKRLMIFVPPRNGKSEIGSILFPAWILGKHPDKEIITASYSADLAQDFGYKTRNLVAGNEYQQLFRTKLRDDSKSKAKWLTEEGGGYTAVGVGGAITGRGADILIIDDPIKNREEAESQVIRDKIWGWYTSTAYTRLEKGGSIILILTRWHKDDLAGRLLKKMEEGGEYSDKWEVIKFPAIATKDEQYRKEGEALWKEKYDIASLLKIKETIGLYDWSSLYMQEPVSSETQEFRESFFRYKTLEEVEALETRRTLTVDTAISQKASADNTGFCLNFTDKENKWHFKAWKKKVSPFELIDDLFVLWEKFKIDEIGIEKTIYLQVVSPFLEDEMRRRNKFMKIVELNHNQTAKETRIRGLLPRYESGSIYHIKGHCVDLEEEELNFPQSLHDDVLDATAYQIQIAKKPEDKYEIERRISQNITNINNPIYVR